MKIVIEKEIDSCQECPNWKRARMYTSDSWEEAYDWFCKRRNDKKIAGYVEWHDVKDIKIPDWCPCLTN